MTEFLATVLKHVLKAQEHLAHVLLRLAKVFQNPFYEILQYGYSHPTHQFCWPQERLVYQVFVVFD